MNESDVDVLIPLSSDENSGGGKSYGIKDSLKLVRDRFIHDFSHDYFFSRWRNAPMDIRFRCTNRCNEKCARCFECSGPENPLNVLPAADIAFYQNSINDWRGVYMTGGEWSLIYDIDRGYMHNVFNAMNLQNSQEYVVQTNCRWLADKNAEKIYSDLRSISKKLGRMGKILKIDVSVDRYRSAAALDGVRELICRVANDKKFRNTKIRIMSCRLDYCMANEKVLRPEYFEPRGVRLKFEHRDFFNPYFQVCYANNTRIVIHEEGPTMRIGRAAQHGFGYKIFYPESQCGGLTDDTLCMELSFREDGTVKWHSYYDWDIVIPYKDAAGKNKPLNQIKSELIQAAWKKRLRKNITNLVYDTIPVFNIARRIIIDRQIDKTFRDNQHTIIYHARDLRQL